MMCLLSACCVDRFHDMNRYQLHLILRANCTHWNRPISGAYRRSHPLSDQLPGEHTEGTNLTQINPLGRIQEEPPSQINSLGSIQEEPPPLRLTPSGECRWSHPLLDELPGEHTEGTSLTQINYIGSIQDKGCLILVSQLK